MALFLDEFGYYRGPDPARNWGPSVAARDGNNQQWRTIGALNALSGQVNHLDNYIVGRKHIIQFYGCLVQAYPQAERVYLIQDNWNFHAHPDVLAALQQWPQLRPVWLSTYAPWLNPIEMLWRHFQREVTHCELIESVEALLKAAQAFFDRYNQLPRQVLSIIGSHVTNLA